MKDGIGEKLGVFTYLMVSFISSIIISFVYGWKLTLVVLSCAPIIVIATAVVAKVQSSLTAQELNAYGQAGSVAEEVLGAIRTVIAFNGEQKEVDRYAEKLVPAEKTGIRRGMWSGVGGGVMWFIIYISYAVAFWYVYVGSILLPVWPLDREGDTRVFPEQTPFTRANSHEWQGNGSAE